MTVTVLGIAFALAAVVDPQGSLYNVRLLPMWFISVYLMAAWAFGVMLRGGGAGLAPRATAALGRGAGGAGDVRGSAGAPMDETGTTAPTAHRRADLPKSGDPPHPPASAGATAGARRR